LRLLDDPLLEDLLVDPLPDAFADDLEEAADEG